MNMLDNCTKTNMKHQTPLKETLNLYSNYVARCANDLIIPADYQHWFQFNFLSQQDRFEMKQDQLANRKLAVLKEDTCIEISYAGYEEIVTFRKGQVFDGQLNPDSYSLFLDDDGAMVIHSIKLILSHIKILPEIWVLSFQTGNKMKTKWHHRPECTEHDCYCADDERPDPICDCGSPAWAFSCDYDNPQCDCGNRGGPNCPYCIKWIQENLV